MSKRIGASIAVSLLLLLIVGCHLQFAGPETSGGPGVVPDAGGARLPAAATDTPLFTATASETPSLTLTFTPEKVTISVSLDTNCRTGPGTVYDYLGGLMVGETTEVLGRDAAGQFWVVRNPDVPGGICWLWDQYATVAGDWQSLPVATPPPTPTPLPTATATPTPVFAVTAVSVRVDRSTYSGPCPYRATWSGQITTTGAGTVKYEWETAMGAGPFSSAGVRTLVFDAAGTKAAADQWLETSSTNPRKARIHIIQPNDMYSSEVSVSITCTP